jgi:hypothetical protein
MNRVMAAATSRCTVSFSTSWRAPANSASQTGAPGPAASASAVSRRPFSTVVDGLDDGSFPFGQPVADLVERPQFDPGPAQRVPQPVIKA